MAKKHKASTASKIYSNASSILFKLVGLFLLIFLPLASFYLGMRYQEKTTFVELNRLALPSVPKTYSFACDEAKTIQATFLNEGESSVKLILSDGRKLDLPHAMSASGARYANKDESFVFWNKGNTAFVMEHDQTTFDNCVISEK